MVVDCGNAEIDPALISQIYARLQNEKYVMHHQTQNRDDDDRTKWFGIHSSALYFKLLPMTESERQRAFLKLDRLINSNLFYKESGLHLIHHEFGDIGMRRADVPEPCLAKNIFVTTKFKSSQVLKFASNLLQDFNSTVSIPNLLKSKLFQIVLGVICSNVTNPNSQSTAELEMKFVLDDLENVSVFISEWFSKLMVSFVYNVKYQRLQDSTWTEIDKIVVKKEIHTKAGILGVIPRRADVYNALRDNIALALTDVGHPLYVLQFIIVPAFEVDFRASHIKSGCKSGTCTQVDSHNIHVYLARTLRGDDEFASRLNSFKTFVDGKTEVFNKAMP